MAPREIPPPPTHTSAFQPNRVRPVAPLPLPASFLPEKLFARSRRPHGSRPPPKTGAPGNPQDEKTAPPPPGGFPQSPHASAHGLVMGPTPAKRRETGKCEPRCREKQYKKNTAPPLIETPARLRTRWRGPRVGPRCSNSSRATPPCGKKGMGNRGE